MTSYPAFDLASRSAKMQEVFASVDRLAASAATVLISGETGTGKSALARTIHQRSPRAERPFVVFDCAAVSPALVESELFGHEKGAFTGSVGAREGALMAAEDGTLFIDELSELPLVLQPKLLRALEERMFRALGSDEVAHVRCRVIAASQQDLAELVKKKQFRQDLFYRIAVLDVSLPPLRERRADIEPLVDQFFTAQQSPMRFLNLPAKTRDFFLSHSWPGNIRELRNEVERLSAGVVAEARQASPAPVADGGPTFLPVTLDGHFNECKEALIRAFEERYLKHLLRRAGGNVSAAAQLGHMSRRHLYELLHRHDLL